MCNFSLQCQYIVEKRCNEKKDKHQSKHQSILFDRILNSQREDYNKCMLYSEEK